MAKTKYAIPNPYNGIQYNTCKNPRCKHFGVHPEDEPKAYSYTYGGKQFPLLKCNSCGETPPMKNNQGIYEEVQRLLAHTAVVALKCTNTARGNHTVPVGTPKAYRSFGKTPQGAQRYRCNGCGKTISQPKATQYQHDTHRNIDIFKALVNKVPFSRIVDMLGISWEVLYNRIDFIHAQCMRFAANREARLSDMDIEKLYISVDRQDHVLNWTERKDKRNVVLAAITSVDNKTGYVFGVHPNFDGTLDRNAIEEEYRKGNDADLPAPLRKAARLWTEADYKVGSKKKRVSAIGANGIYSEIAAKYQDVSGRDDVEAFDHKNTDEKLPDYGMQIHAEYTMIAHFYYLKAMMGKVKKWRFFLDQESGIRAAALAAFREEVKEHKAEAFYVRITKELTVDEKRILTNDAKRKFNELKADYPELTDEQVKLELLKKAIDGVRDVGQWKDRWVAHPLPDMSEPEKAMCWLTKHDKFDEDHVAWLYNKATLHGVNSFFAKVRRRISLFERSINSASSTGRVWNGYSAYNPAIVGKLLDIFRVVHNYVDIRKVKGTAPTTAAMRFGLAKAPTDYKDILYYE